MKLALNTTQAIKQHEKNLRGKAIFFFSSKNSKWSNTKMQPMTEQQISQQLLLVCTSSLPAEPMGEGGGGVSCAR